MNKKYQDVVRRVSIQIADEFLAAENDLEKRALLPDADIAEITRQIGSETTEIIPGNTLRQCAEKKSMKDL
jgi:hypothetical protein